MKRALVVDDDPDVARLFRTVLERRGWSVRWAATGEDGLRAASEEPPDVVFVDETLPDLVDGYEFAVRLRRDPANRGIRLIRMPGKPTEADRFRGAWGIDGYLHKPLRPRELGPFAERALAYKRPEDEP